MKKLDIDLQKLKLQYNIVGKDEALNTALRTAIQVAPTDLSVLIEGENVVIVKVDNKRHAEDVPTLIFDWWNYGGITRDVRLVKVPKLYFEDYKEDYQICHYYETFLLVEKD